LPRRDLPRPPEILLAPDSFKGTHSSREVCAALARGVESAGARAIRLAAADGGEGTMRCLLAALGGELRTATVSDPLGRPIEAGWALLADGRAVVEAAQASGLGLVSPGERDPWAASTYGTGELIGAAADAGAEEILVAVGGTATTDGGAGALSALGGARRLPPLRVLCDVRTTFEGAAPIFGPQKGADPALVARLAERLEGLARSMPRDPRGVEMTGCGGGLSGGLWAQLDAELVPGAAFVLGAIGFDEWLAEAAATITGEGRLDEQTAAGKVVAEVARRSAAGGVPCHAVVGSTGPGAGAIADELGLAGVRVASTLAELERAGAALAGGLAGEGD
jgi:glycerate kinase